MQLTLGARARRSASIRPSTDSRRLRAALRPPPCRTAEHLRAVTATNFDRSASIRPTGATRTAPGAVMGQRHGGSADHPRSRHRFSRPRRPGARGATASPSACGPARPSRSSANRARENPSSARRSWASCREIGRDHAGRDPVRRPAHARRRHRHRQARSRRPRDARHPRRPHLDHLPGADDVALAAAHDRRPGHRGAAPPSRRDRGGGEALAEEMLRLRRLSRPAQGAPHLSVRAFGRPAPARYDRDGAGVPPGLADRRRADHRARRDDPGADPEAHAGSAAGTRHGAPAHHPRSRRRRQHGRRGRGHVSRRGDGGGVREDIFRDPQHPYLRRCCMPCRASTWRRASAWCRCARSRSETGHLLAAKEAWPANGRQRRPAALACENVTKTLPHPQASGWFGSGTNALDPGGGRCQLRASAAANAWAWSARAAAARQLSRRSCCARSRPTRASVDFNDRGIIRRRPASWRAAS